MSNEDFMRPEEHFNVLLSDLPVDVQLKHDNLKHVRTEVAYRGRTFVIYRMEGRQPVTIDRITVNDFECDEDSGASTEVFSTKLGKVLEIGYAPVPLFDYPIFMWLPLHCKLRWSATASNPCKGSLGFPLVVRTQSRHHLREKKVIYCETGPSFGNEFDAKSLE